MSENEEKLRSAFSQGLRIPMEQLKEDISYNSTPGWDSIAHMALIGSLDATFNIMMETDDIIDLSSYQKAKEILAKYGVRF